jgi:UDP-N-acetylglucosamine--N-acetylmuramyl-(pentapeptide) pyrophosphoryl-undecaprenol N-acetylglucosamine transferase
MAIDVLLAGGGTAGHVLPAVATAHALLRRRPELRVALVGVQGGIEERIAAAAELELEHVPAVPLPRRITPALATVPLRLRSAVRSARSLLRSEQVRAVVAFGGYVALPVALAARGRVPLVLHEQNARPGLANRVASRFADAVAVTYASSAQHLAHPERCRCTGNPVQERLRDLDRAQVRAGARVRLGLDADRPTLLAFGGSQGARSINRALAGAAPGLARLGLQVLHVSGPRGHDDAVEAWRWAGVEPLPGRSSAGHPGADGSPSDPVDTDAVDPTRPSVRILPYLDDMSDAYAAADLVLARAGATSLAEIGVLGLPAVLVPYPHATGDHQRANARAAAAAGSAVVLDDADLDAAALEAALRHVLAHAGTMSLAARTLARPDAAEGVAAVVLEVMDRRGA